MTLTCVERPTPHETGESCPHQADAIRFKCDHCPFGIIKIFIQNEAWFLPPAFAHHHPLPVTGGNYTMDIDLDLARIEEASRVVDPAFRDSPQFVSELLCAALGRNVLVKIETANPLGSFKGRGASFLVRSLPPGSTVVCASSGNFGVALAYAARTRAMGVHVYVSPDTNQAKLARMQNLGAEVIVDDRDPRPGSARPRGLAPRLRAG